MKKGLLITFILITLYPVINLFSQKTQDSLSNKVDSLFAKYNNTESPGAAVLVVRDGKVIFCRGYGMANLEYKVPITSSTIFDIASLSKQFTGMAVAILIEQGKISLNDDIRLYIPELPDFGHKIAIDNLIHHTSGLRDWPGTLSIAGWRMDDVITFDQILNMAFNQQALNFEPGTEYAYSNTGYNLLAELVKRVTGKTFREWTDSCIFQPLGMKNTHFHDDYTEVFSNKAYGYKLVNDGKYLAINNGLTALGSSSLYTSMDDLAKWVINMDNPDAVGKQVVERMFQQGILKNGEQIEYAFGIEIGKYRGLKEISHSGSWASFSTYLAYFPEQHISIVVLHNFPANSYRAIHNIADIYMVEKFEQPIKTNNLKSPAADSIDLPPSLLSEYIGTYRLGVAWYVTISKNGNRLTASATDEKCVPMISISSSTFWVKGYGDSIKFNIDNKGRVISFLYHGRICPKIENVQPPNKAKLAELTGDYISSELKAVYSVILEDNKLVIKNSHHGVINLRYSYMDDFRSDKWFMRAIEFYRNKKGKVVGLRISDNYNSSNAQSRNLQFVKYNPQEKEQ